MSVHDAKVKTKSVVHHSKTPDGKPLLIVDPRDAEKDTVVAIVMKHGEIFKSGEGEPQERHKFIVMTVPKDDRQKFTMIRNEQGKFSHFSKASAPKNSVPKKRDLGEKKSVTAGVKKQKGGEKRNLTDADIAALAKAINKQ